MPQNCSVPYCTKKVYEENGVKTSFHKFPDDEGRKKTFKSSAVPSVFPWTKGSPAKKRAPKHISLIKKKSPKKTSETTTISDSSNSTCVSSPVDSRENQESPDLENLDNSSAEELLDDREEKLHYNLRNKKKKALYLGWGPWGKIKQLTMEIEQLSAKNNSFQAKVFSLDRFITSDKDLFYFTGFPNASVLESILRYLNPGKARGDSVMADKGSTLQDLLPLGVFLNIPPFLGSK
ncbi:unnamed protein product, partial [Porites lobata]